MFTGIVEEIGTIISAEMKNNIKLWDNTIGNGFILVIKCVEALKECYVGCSIAVNGTCLTVIEFDKESFTVNCAPETLRCTNLESLKAGDKVNLERALKEGGRNSGHIVQGHVDCTGVLDDKHIEGDSLWIRIRCDNETVMRQIVPKGFVALDGTSLTVCEVTENTFTVMLISHTQQHIIIPQKNVGDKINIETDITGKYIYKYINNIYDTIKSMENRLNERLDKIEMRVSQLENKK